MKTVTKFQANDGSIHDNEKSASLADAEHALDTGINKLIQKNVPYSDYQSAVSNFINDPDIRLQLEKLFVQHHNAIVKVNKA